MKRLILLIVLALLTACGTDNPGDDPPADSGDVDGAGEQDATTGTNDDLDATGAGDLATANPTTDTGDADGGDPPDADGGGTDVWSPDIDEPDTQDTSQPDVPVAPETCESDKDCADAGLLCDPLSGTCVDCLFDSDCGQPGHCQKTVCVAFAPCSTSEDCSGETPVCNAAIGECAGCVTPEDCGDGAHCTGAVCTPFTACVSSKDCTAQVCDKRLGECVDCIEDPDCEDNQACNAAVCVDVFVCDSDKDCLDMDMLCDKEAGICIGCFDHVDCPEAYHCAAGECALDVCAWGTVSCVGSAAVPCNTVGDGFDAGVVCTEVQTCVQWGLTAGCEDHVCAAGLSVCVGNAVESCSADGLTITDSVACGEKFCVAGECKSLVCEPSAVFCADDQLAVNTCSDDGLSAISQGCDDGTFCEGAVCVPALCTPGEPFCSANTAGVCNTIGSGFLGDGGPCGDQLCLDGECLPLVCLPGSVTCEDGLTISQCGPDGTTETLDPCEEATFCTWEEGADATCQDWVCTPGAKLCDGNLLTDCNELGSGPTPDGADCGEELCYEGECQALLCLPGSSFCGGEGAVILECVAGGTSVDVIPCGPAKYCQANGATAACNDQVCPPGAPMCDGNKTTVCDAKGAGPVPNGTDCGEEFCTAAECQDLVCLPGGTFCLGNVIHACSDNGQSTVEVLECSSESFCKEIETQAECALKQCEPGQPACIGAIAGTCNANGSGLLAGGTNCQPMGCWAGECGNPPVGLVPDCSAEPVCTGPGEAPILCGLDICYPGAELAQGVTIDSPSNSTFTNAVATVPHFGSADNDLTPHAGGSYVLLATGPATGTSHSVNLGGMAINDVYGGGGNDANDVMEITLQLTAPPTATGFAVRSLFLSVEYEEYIGSSFNDKFYMVLTAPTTTDGAPQIINATGCKNAGEYFDFQKDGKTWCYMAINTAFSEPCSAPVTNIAGTGFECGAPDSSHGSSTGWLRTTHPIQGGEAFTLIFHIHDSSDSIYDSEVILDDFEWLFDAAVPSITTSTGPAAP